MSEGVRAGTEPAQRDKEVPCQGLVQRMVALMRLARGRPQATLPAKATTLRVVAMTAVEDAPLPDLSDLSDLSDLPGCGLHPGSVSNSPVNFRWRRHPQLRQRGEPGAAGDPDDLQRGARSAAVRGLFLARSARFDEARMAFALGAAESSVDLTAIPGFWDLPRSGMLAAVDAYDDVGRFRDAAALGARIRLTYRPRSVAHVGGPPRPRESG